MLQNNRSHHVPLELTVVVAWLAAAVLLYRSFGHETPAALGSSWEHVAVARSLAAGHGFSNPFGESNPTGSTAILAPVHPAMLAMIFTLFGYGSRGALAAVLMEVAIQVIAIVLLIRVSTAAFSSYMPGVFAAASMLILTKPLPAWENATAWLGMEVIFLLLISRAKVLWTGVALGAAWLVSPSLIPASVMAALILRNVRYAITSGAIGVVLIAPWIVRNSLIFHQAVFLRDSFGLELRVSNNDQAEPSHTNEGVVFSSMHPSQNATIATELRRIGEPSYFRSLQTDALEWIHANPKHFLQLTIQRMTLWWSFNWQAAGLNLLGLAGVFLSRSTRMGQAAGSAWALYSLPYFIVQFDSRYTWPVLWLSALMAGYACMVSMRSLFFNEAHESLEPSNGEF